MMMHRKIRPTAAVLAAAGTAVAMTLATAATASAASAAVGSPAACTTAFPIVVSDFAFSPATVAPGGYSTATLITGNCSSQPVTSTEIVTGQWIPWSGSGLPAGCPVIDPLLRTVDYGPGAQFVESAAYTVPASCSAAELDLTVRIYVNGTLGLTKTAVLHIQQVIPAG